MTRDYTAYHTDILPTIWQRPTWSALLIEHENRKLSYYPTVGLTGLTFRY